MNVRALVYGVAIAFLVVFAVQRLTESGVDRLEEREGNYRNDQH